MGANNAQMAELGKRIVPIMQEYGLVAFVIAGYVEDGDGKVKRFCVAQTGGNPAFEDGLRPLINFSLIWAAPSKNQSPDNEPPE